MDNRTTIFASYGFLFHFFSHVENGIDSIKGTAPDLDGPTVDLDRFNIAKR